MESALIPRYEWPQRLAQLRMMGFNTVRTSAPWNLHERRAGHRDFSKSLDVAAFLAAARTAGLHTILRIGPVVGDPFPDGGLPPWTGELSQGRVREADLAFLAAVSGWFQELLREVSPHQAAGPRGEADAGSLIAVEIEQHWQSGDPTAAEPYFDHLMRLVRERGLLVPILTNNGLWAQPAGTIEMWEGSKGLFAHARQLRTVQPDAPGLVVVRADADSKQDFLARSAHAAASGAQLILAGEPGSVGFDTNHGALRRLALATTCFGSALAACEPQDQAFAADPAAGPRNTPHVVPLSGAAGTLVWVLAPKDGSASAPVSLVSPQGRTLEVHLSKRAVEWAPFNVDLHGAGRLDWSSLTLVAMVGKRMLVVCGAAGTRGQLSVDGAVLECHVPASSAKPLVVAHQRVVVVVVNHAQADTVLVNGTDLYVGAHAVTASGSAHPARGFKRALRVAASGALHNVDTPRREPVPKAPAVSKPEPESKIIQGTHARYALMKQPLTLAACGASGGTGWYRMAFTQPRTAVRTLAWPNAGGDITWWLDGKPLKRTGCGPVELKFSAGVHLVVAHVAHRPARVPGTAIVPSGFGSQVIDVEAVSTVKARSGEPNAVNPFALRAHLRGVNKAQLQRQVACVWEVPAPKAARSQGCLLLHLSADPLRGVVSVGSTCVALVDSAEPASTLVTLQTTDTAEKSLCVRFTPFDGASDATIQRILSTARWFRELPASTAHPAPVWAFARAEAGAQVTQ